MLLIKTRTNTASGVWLAPRLFTSHPRLAFMYTVWHCVWFIGKTMTVSLFLQHPDSEPPGMIINVIIKHLLPTAPAVSLSPLDPGDHREGEQEGEGGRDTGGARGRG